MADWQQDPGSFDVRFSRPVPSELWVHGSGELDIVAAGALAAVLDDGLDVGVTHVGIDLAEVGFIDSAGIRALTELHHRVRDAGGRCQVLASSRVREVLELSGLVDVLDIVTDSEE